MRLHRSNRAEQLVERLVRCVQEPLTDPFATECICVQSRGMERWLSMQLAERLGVWSNPDFPFPRVLLERVFDAVLGPQPAALVYQPASLLWAVAAMLPEYLDARGFEAVARYLQTPTQARQGETAAARQRSAEPRALQLAARIAACFDQYVVYRPELIARWEAGHDEGWQAQLWRALWARHGPHHFAARSHALLNELRRDPAPRAGLPQRIFLFGISTLPPLLLEALGALSRSVETHLFVLSPSHHYWADLSSRRDLLRGQPHATTSGALALAEGHPLLGSLGRVGREFQQLIEQTLDYSAGSEQFAEPDSDSALHRLQTDMLHLTPTLAQPSARRPPLASTDTSIRVHACHGPLREVQVIHDQLCALLEDDPTLEPRQIVVMTPQIEAYAPMIEAVFCGSGRPQLPFRIADRGPAATQPLLDAFAALLECLGGRLTATSVLDLVAMDPIRERFGIRAADLERLRVWVADSGIRWGVDSAQREAEGQPATDANTWRFGLERLLLGYAMPAAGDELFQGRLPHPDVEGSEAALLGRFAELAEQLFCFRQRLLGRRTLSAWRLELEALLQAMLAAEENYADGHQQVRAALSDLCERAILAGFEHEIDLDILRRELDRSLSRERPAYGFLSGGVTFCQLIPMRSIPFRVVCLMGMNEPGFPRTEPATSFDVMSAQRRVGDRCVRDDDRYLVLEAILAARDCLIVSYVGQDIHTNQSLPPSGIVDELLDCLEASFAPEPSQGVWARQRFVLRHRLQPFSPAYFGQESDSRLFSYAQNALAGARALCGERKQRPRFYPASTETARADDPSHGHTLVQELTLTEFERWLTHPLRTFVRRELGLHLGQDAQPLADREPMQLDALERWRVGEAVLQASLEGRATQAELERQRAGGRMPLGTPGDLSFEEVAPTAQRIADCAAQYQNGNRLGPLRVDVLLDGLRLVGELGAIWPDAQLWLGYSSSKSSELKHWLRHLLLCYLHELDQATGYPRRSVLVRRSEKTAVEQVAFLAPEAPATLLGQLCAFVRQAQNGPLPFLAKSSRAFADKTHQGKPEAAQHAAYAMFNRSTPGSESLDPYVLQVYGSEPDPIQEPRFEELANGVFGPLLRHRQTL